MEYRYLGRSGLRVSLTGLGCTNMGMRIDNATARKIIDKALDLGVNLLDVADVYGNRGGSETALGDILGSDRKNFVLASKFGQSMDDAGFLAGGSRRYIMSAVEGSLRRLKTDWIDLYQVHAHDPMTPIEETLRALDDLVRQGKVRYIGCSNFPVWRMTEAAWAARLHGREAFISSQDEYSLLMRDPDKERIEAMQAYGIGLLPYFPLASGMLSGRYRRGEPVPDGSRLKKVERFASHFLTARNFDVLEQLQAFCASRGRTTIELAFSWLARRPIVSSIIAGASTPEQLEYNMNAVNWDLSPGELEEIDRITITSEYRFAMWPSPVAAAASPVTPR
jgi:aryl-alcohol dehydrogenase-like predicted oxidoreductase